MKLFRASFWTKFVVTLFVVGIVIGFLFYFSYKPDISGYLENFKDLLSKTRQNTFLISIILISSIFILSITIIGFPAIVFYIFYEGLSIGFTFAAFLSFYGIKGFLFYFIFFIFSKVIYILLMLYFSVLSIKFVIKIVNLIKSKRTEEMHKTIVYQFYRFIIVLFGIIINSFAIYLFSHKILRLFSGLI